MHFSLLTVRVHFLTIKTLQKRFFLRKVVSLGFFRDSNWKCVVVISAIVVYSKQLRDLNIFGNILVIEKT